MEDGKILKIMEWHICIVIFSIALAIIVLINAISDVTEDDFLGLDDDFLDLDDDFDFFY